MKALSLFSGIGGIDLACEWAGIETIAFCEREPFCQSVIRKHWPGVPIYDDVRTLTKARIEADGIDTRTIGLISAGYPCQPFSHAGKREGENDDRHLWPEVRRLVESIRPNWFVGENVAGHITLGLDEVLSDLGNIRYTFQSFIIPACSVGSPQRRDRVFIVANSQGVDQRRLSIGEKPAFTRLTRSGEDVAHTESERCGETREYQPRRAEEWTSSSSREQFNPRTVKSELGGMLDGVSRRLDGHRWPAYWGEEQYDWEPQRLAARVKNRPERIKALGNAVNPHQMYPILAAIKQIDGTEGATR